MTLEKMVADLPTACDTGEKRNTRQWMSGELAGIQVAHRRDGRGLAVSCSLTSALLYDSQAAIPLAKLTAGRVQNLYDLMDSAYDAEETKACSRQPGHVPPIEGNPL